MNDNFPMAREGVPYLLVTLAVGALFAVGGFWLLSLVFFVLASYVVFFFRNPERLSPAGVDQIACPADGKVVFVGPSVEKEFLQEERIKISVFMSLFDVHINRSPLNASVRNIRHRKGRFLAAFDDRASEENERNTVLLETDQGDTMVLVQIAGLVARRIICYPAIGSFLIKGQRFGLIQFGSRVDIYLPKNAVPQVKTGDRVVGGETLLATFQRRA